MQFRSMRFLSFVALMIAMVVATSFGGKVSAQEASPEAVDMGSASAALGMGTEMDAFVNILHASPDAPAVDIWVDGAKAVEGLAFGSATGWVALPAGDHQVTVTPAGGTADQAVIDVKVTLEADHGYEVAAAGLVANIGAHIYPVNFAAAGENARVRVVHTSPDAPAVDIALKGGDVLVPNLAFPSASDYLEVPAASYDFEVRAAGTTTVALDLPGVALEAGMVYSVYAIGQLGDGTLTVFVIASPSEGAMMATPEATPSM